MSDIQNHTKENNQSDSANYLKPEQLRVGMFVELDLPWFEHDFALSSFKIRNEAQLREVLNLRLRRYRYNPERSDAPEAEQASQAPDKAILTEEKSVVCDDPVILAEQQRAVILAQREERIRKLEKGFGKAVGVMRNLNRNLLSKPKETLEDMGVLVDEMITAFIENLDVTLHVMGDKAGGEDVYYHSLNVTILAMMLARELGFTSEMAHDLGVGAMLHDIGLMKIPDRISKKSFSESTSAERNLRAMHVEYGIEIGRQIGISEGALAVLAQHHEFVDGSGYPNGLKEAEIAPAARIVSLVNHYDSLCNPPDISRAMSPHNALSLMFAQRRNKFEARALTLLIRSLGVYPPGSLVQLSNEAFAAVISINPKNALRPCLIVYDPKIPKEKAIILDLEQEPEISIVKAISPASLPLRVSNYLNPRKRITYFFDSDKQPGSE